MTAGSLDLGALFATVDIVDAPFQRKYVRLLAQFSRLGGEAASSGAGAAKLDESLVGVGASAEKASVGLGRVSESTTRAAAAEAKAVAAAERHSVATANVNRVVAQSAGLNARQRQAALQLTAAQDRLNAAQESGVATTRSLASAQAGLIGAQRRVEAAQVSMATRMTNTGKKLTAAITAPVLIAAGVAAKTAMDFDAATNVYVTAAGESVKNLGVVREGIKRTAVETGTSIKNLTDAEYLIEKAGLRGANGLRVLNASAKGAREENANLSDVVQAETSIMASYHLSTDKAVQVVNALKTGAGQAKVTMEDFAGSLSTVIPIASANHIALGQVLGAEATLTQHGTSAKEATQELAATIRNLAKPNRVAMTEMQQLGLSVVDVTKNLGRRGLTGTIDLLVGAITQHMGKAGLVLQNAFNQSKTAGQDAQIMLEKMPPAVAKLATAYQNGKITLGDWRKQLKLLPADQASLAQQFTVVTNKANGFNSMIRAGDPAAQTFTSALGKVSGGAIGLNTILQLSGENMAGFKDRTDAVGKSLHDNAKEVEGWDSTSKLASTHSAQFRESLHVLAINAGATLLPMLKEVADKGSSAIKWIEGLSHGQKEMLGWSVAVIAMLGPVLSVFGRLITLIGGVGKAITTLRTTTLGGVAGAAGLSYLGGAIGSNEVAKHVNGSSGLGAAATVSGGFLTGAATGAAFGSIAPGIGTLVGAGVGGAIGSVAGLVTAFHHTGDAAKAAGAVAKAALEAQKASADALYQSLVAAGGAYTDMTRGEIAGQLNDSGALDIADKAGIDPGKLISGVLGSDGQRGVAKLSTQLENAYAAGKITWPELQKVQKSLGLVGAAAISSEKKIELQARAMHGGVLTAAQLGTSMAKLRAALHATGTSLDFQSASGIRNNEVIKEEVRAANAAVWSGLRHHKSVTAVATAYETQIGTLRRNLKQMGFNGEEIDAIITKYGRVPKSVATNLKKRGVVPADIQAIIDKYKKIPPSKTTNLRLIDYITGKLIAIKAHLDSINGKTVVITEETLHTDGSFSTKGTAGVTTKGSASGGTLPEGVSAVGEQGAELAIKRGGRVDILSNRQSKAYLATTGMRAPGFAAGTSPTGISLTMGAASGFASVIKSQTGTAAAAMRDLSRAVNIAFSLKGIEKSIDAVKAKIVSMKEYRSGITSTLAGAFDPTRYGSVADLTAGLAGATSTNKAYSSEINSLYRKTHGNRALTSFINQLAASGQTATLQTLAGASSSQLAQIAKSVGAYQGSLTLGGNSAVYEKYGATIASQQRAETRLEGQRAVEVRNIDKLVAAIAHLTKRPVEVRIGDKVIAHAVIRSSEFEGVIDELSSQIHYGRSS